MKAFDYFPPNQQVYLGHRETGASVQKRLAGEGTPPLPPLPLPDSDRSEPVSLLVSGECTEQTCSFLRV